MCCCICYGSGSILHGVANSSGYYFVCVLYDRRFYFYDMGRREPRYLFLDLCASGGNKVACLNFDKNCISRSKVVKGHNDESFMAPKYAISF